MNSKIEWEQVTRCRCEADRLPVHSLETFSSSASNEDCQSGPVEMTVLCWDLSRSPDSETSSIECDKIGVTQKRGQSRRQHVTEAVQARP